MLIGLVITSYSAHAQVDSVTASVDKNPAMADESIVLSVVAIGEAQPNDFDPSVLTDDFFVGRTSTSTQTRMINFNTTRSTTWSTVLIPRKEGTYTIPEFNVGGKSTQPITVRVLPASAVSKSNVRDAFVTTEVDTGQPYVQQLVKYTIKIYLAVELQRGTLANPHVAGAELKKLGEDKRYSEIVDGQRYNVIERSYGVIPQSSGPLTIKGPLFEAEIIDRNRNNFSYFNQTKPINRVSPDVTLDVQAIPNSYSEHWLPSEFVQLNEEWQPDLAEIKVGEPITRTLTLSVLGVAEEQLPLITGIYPPDFKVYPDQPTTTSVLRDTNLIAQRVENIAIIPNRAGQFVLPPVKVAWFNIVTKQIEYAELPAKSIVVAQASNSNGAMTSPGIIANPQQQTEMIDTLNEDITPTIKTIEVARFWSASSWLMLALWILTILVWIWLSHFNKRVTSVIIKEDCDEPQRWNELKAALKSRHIGKIYIAIQNWRNKLQEQTGSHANIDKMWQKDISLQQQIDMMFASEYSDGKKTWKNDKLLQALAHFRTSAQKLKTHSAALHELYKET
jgi:hypothetical protein